MSPRSTLAEHEAPSRAAAGGARAAAEPPAVHYRLRGKVGEEERTFLLAPGDNPVGGSPSNAVVLAVRGVSRRHAVLRAAPEGLGVEDLASKNGTFVNGRPVARSPLAAGDEVRFGPVALRLETVPADDAELGLALPARGAPAAEPSTRRETPWRQAEGLLPAASWLRLAGDVLAGLATPPAGDLAAALGLVARSLELDGAAYVEWGAGGKAVLLAAAGRVGDLPAPAELAAAHGGDPGLRWGADVGVPPLTWAATGGGRSLEGVALWGDFPGREGSEPLLTLLVRLFARFRDRPLASLDAPPASGRPRLAFPPGYLPGDSPAMSALYRQMEPLVAGDLPVLLVGETGVGKEPLARTLHASSPRGRGPFVAINCAAIPADLLEAELFGIGRQVATGVAERPGKFAEAAGGTLLLDEIGDMPLALQAKLLRSLQEREVHPVGKPAQPLDARVLASTNQDLAAAVGAGRFRRDLFYRVAGYVLRVPPLRERREDLPRLVGHLLRQVSREAGKSPRGVTVKALRMLSDYPWPGNVRELEHEVRRLVYLCPDGGAIDSDMVSAHILHPSPEEHSAVAGDSFDLAAHTAALERRLIAQALARAGGNQSQAARLLGVSRNGLALRLRRLGIQG